MSCPVCGYRESKGKPRSIDQHRRYFSLIRKAFDQWPDDHDNQFANAEELRSFLQIKAGWREIGAQIPLTGMSKERAMLLAEAAIRGAGSYAMPIIHGDTLVVFRPKSVSFARMPHLEFCALSTAVGEIIQSVLGVDPDELLKAEAA